MQEKSLWCLIVRILLGGMRVEGNLVEKGRESFVGQYPIPYIYGLTPGELAEYLNNEGLLGAGVSVDLTVIPMDGWQRNMTFSKTGMPWVLPSPHIPTTDAALLYPATGIMGELSYVSIGVGYTLLSASRPPHGSMHRNYPND